MLEVDADGCMKWQRIEPPVWWPAARRHVIADRHLPDGTRQHLVEGSIPAGTVVANAQVLGAADMPDIEFSSQLSHLSGRLN